MTKKLMQQMKRETVLGAFKSVDKKITDELQRLNRDENITATCKCGCHFCCRQLINVPIPEIDVIAQYIKDEFDEERINNIKNNTKKWFKWVDEELPNYLEKGIEQQEAFYNHGPYCPLLFDGECSVYPVRPLICRGYYVSSDPRSCRPTNDPLALEDEPTILRSIPSVGREEGLRIVQLVLSSGIEFSHAVFPLPYGISIAMKWSINRKKNKKGG